MDLCAWICVDLCRDSCAVRGDSLKEAGTRVTALFGGEVWVGAKFGVGVIDPAGLRVSSMGMHVFR